MPIGRIANRQRPCNRLRTLRFDLAAVLLDRRRNRRAPRSLRAKKLHRLWIDQPEQNQLIKRLLDLRDERSASHRHHDVIGQAPAELLGDFIAHRLRSLSIIRTQIHVHESPAAFAGKRFIGDLRAQAIDVVVAAVDAHQLRAKHLRAQNLRRLEIGWNEDPGFQSFAGRLRSHRIRQIARGRASDGIEAEAASIRQSHGDHAVFETQRGQADGVILNQQPSRSNLRAQSRRANQRGEPYGQRRLKARRQRQQLAIAPNIRSTRGKQFARDARSKRIVIVGDFERRETVFADTAGLIAPSFAAFAAAEFVRARSHLAASFCDCGTSRVKIPH